MMSNERPSLAALGETKALFVARLQRLMRLRRAYVDDLNPLGLRLLDRALHSTYQDCLEFGGGQEANRIMAQHPVPGWDQDVRGAW